MFTNPYCGHVMAIYSLRVEVDSFDQERKLFSSCVMAISTLHQDFGEGVGVDAAFIVLIVSYISHIFLSLFSPSKHLSSFFLMYPFPPGGQRKKT